MQEAPYLDNSFPCDASNSASKTACERVQCGVHRKAARIQLKATHSRTARVSCFFVAWQALRLVKMELAS